MAKRARVIPPEVLAKMDPRIVSGERPVFYEMQLEDIFHTDKAAIVNADVIRFDFRSENLSSAQRDLLSRWLRDGKRVVFLVGREVGDFSWLIPGVEARDVYRISRGERWTVGLTSHPVNADCRDIESNSNGVYFLAHLPEGSQVVAVAEADTTSDVSPFPPKPAGPLAIAGVVPVGKSLLYYSPGPLETPDSFRWQLNLYHWMCGKPIPPPSITPTSAAPAAAEGIDAE